MFPKQNILTSCWLDEWSNQQNWEKPKQIKPLSEQDVEKIANPKTNKQP